MINIIKTLLVITAHIVKILINGNYNNGIAFLVSYRSTGSL